MTPHDDPFPCEARIFEFRHRLREAARILGGGSAFALAVWGWFGFVGPLLACGLLGGPCQ